MIHHRYFFYVIISYDTRWKIKSRLTLSSRRIQETLSFEMTILALNCLCIFLSNLEAAVEPV